MSGCERIANWRSKGFTLIELMIVLAIMGGVLAMAMPYLSNRNSQTKAVLRELTVMSRELHTRAKLQGAIYRLVIDLGADSGSKPRHQQYWIERGKAGSVLKPNEEEAERDALKDLSDDDKKKGDPSGFAVDHSMMKKPRELPRGMKFDRIELSRLKNPATDGKVFIHYLPEGLTDEAAIHIKGEKKSEWTISIHPLTGKAELISKPVTLQEMKQQ